MLGGIRNRVSMLAAMVLGLGASNNIATTWSPPPLPRPVEGLGSRAERRATRCRLPGKARPAGSKLARMAREGRIGLRGA
jgi:hypothetical protein